MATSSTTHSLYGGTSIKTFPQSNKLKLLSSHRSQLAISQSLTKSNHRRNVSVRAEFSDGSRGGGGDFVAGFLLGGAVFGTLAYVFAPQIRKSVLNENEDGFRKAKRPLYYDEGLEKTRQTLNDKISQLNSAIDNVSSRLRRAKNVETEPAETESEVESTA
ncbi:hypothetical protein ACMD2_07033 [Ananas comosus]|uniref:Uncharacterized protein n=1 Tax=Ananas comosus TaxID=4615 RepID=A0A199VJ55_ANACO|nr:hypothetical protein ACMD2_07033 [Ananas comosus]